MLIYTLTLQMEPCVSLVMLIMKLLHFTHYRGLVSPTHQDVPKLHKTSHGQWHTECSTLQLVIEEIKMAPMSEGLRVIWEFWNYNRYCHKGHGEILRHMDSSPRMGLWPYTDNGVHNITQGNIPAGLQSFELIWWENWAKFFLMSV